MLKIRGYWSYEVVELAMHERSPKFFNPVELGERAPTMHSGVLRSLSGGSSSRRRALTKESAEMTNDAALVTWLFRAGVGSSSSRKLLFS